MAGIILINDQDQEQTLTGVEKLVTRGTDGDVEFSLGGGGGGGVSVEPITIRTIRGVESS